MRRVLTLIALLLAAHGTATAEELRLAVLHTTDLHGSLTAFDYFADRPAARGLAKVATLVRRARAEGRPTLLLDGGDALQGSPLQTVYRLGSQALPEPMMAAMSLIGYDAMAVGNHEFDYGPAARERARGEAGFPWLSANVTRAADGAPAFQTSLVKRFGDLTIGVVGLTTPATAALLDSSRWLDVRFGSPVEAARREVARLRDAEKCDAIVLLAHTGLIRDPDTGVERQGEATGENLGERLANEVPGVDLIVLGHTHATIPSREIHGVLVTQAGQRGEGLGRADLVFTRDRAGQPWGLTRRSARVIAVTDTTPDDSAVVRLAIPYHAAAQAALVQVVGRAARPLGSPRGRWADGPVWDLVHAAQLEASGADVSLAPLFDPAFAIPAGPILLRDALSLYPYDNTLAVVELTGAQLKETLEQSARTFADYTYEHARPLEAPGRPGYGFETATGVSYEIDLTRPAGQRIVNLFLGTEPLAAERRLKVAVSSYRLNGGGGFDVIRDAPRLWRSERTIRDLIVDYLRRHEPVAPAAESNWTLLPDYAPLLERPLIDLLVRQNVAPREEVLRLHPDEPARRGDLAYWLSRAYGWRATRPSGAFADVPDSLEPWLDGLVKRRVLGEAATVEEFRPFAPTSLSLALDWCERAARHERYALASPADVRSFRVGLLTGILPDASLAAGASFYRDTLTRAQVMGMVANARFPTIRVLGTTDFHGAILPGARDRRGRAWGGSAVLAAHLRRLRAENPFGTVLVDGGDWYQGTMISNLPFGRPVVQQMNELGYSAAAIGNHEFDWTADTLLARIHELRAAALGANIRVKKNGKRPAWARTDTSLVRRGVRVSVFGLAYRYTPSVTLPRYVAHLRFEDDSTTAARLVPELRKRAKPEVVVGIGHIPTTQDSAGAMRGDLARLARGVPGVDLWLGGHSHNRVEGSASGVPVLIAGSHGQLIAVVDLVVDPVRDRVAERYARIVPTYADQVPPDSTLAAMVKAWNADVAKLSEAPVGRNAARLTRARGGESTVGNLVTDAMRAAVNADIALQNSGGLRADLDEGVVTKGDVFEVMPFENTIVTMDLTGAEVRRALEEGLRFERVTQVSGLRYTFALDRPDFERVSSLTLADGTPLDSARTFKVAVNNFMAEGGDDYSALRRGRNTVDTALTVREVLEAYVSERCSSGRALDYRPEGRVTRAPGSAPPSRPD